jgi:heptose I phosphotransferase
MPERSNKQYRFDGSHELHRPAAPLAPSDDALMWVDREYDAELKRLGLVDFDAVMRHAQGRLLRTLPDRENWRLEFSSRGRRQVLFLKKHRERWPLSCLRGWFARTPPATPGRIEAENVSALLRAGIESMRVVAFGEQVRGGLAESFFMTEELHGFTQLDHFLRRRFVPAAERTRFDHELAALADAVADVAHRFHGAGFNHRDFYCCHLFIQELPDGCFAVRVIDLQRVERRHWLRSRWIVKDLAQLAYSAPRERVTRSLQMRFFKRYLGVARLSAADKRLVRRVLRRRQAMQRRLGAHP